MKYDVSIVIPAHNEVSTISKTIEGCLAQKYPEDKIEIICVDDGSVDETKEIIKNYSIKYIYQEKGGPAKARNTGWKLAKGKIICFTDADCMPEKDWVTKLVKNYKSKKIGAVGGSYKIANNEKFLADCIHLEIIYRHSRMSKYVQALGSYNLSVKKSVLKTTGGFNEEYTMASGEDNDLCYNILKHGYKLIFEKEAKVFHFYPNSLMKYFKTQFWHGFWRVKLYADHPIMVRGDDYSNIWDYIQPVLSLIILFLIPFNLIFPFNYILLFFLFFEIILQLPLPFLIVIRTKKYKYIMLIPITFLRGFARGLGMFSGSIKFFLLGNLFSY